MIKEFTQAWYKHKDKLEKYFATTKQGEYYEYGKLVQLLFDIVINPELNEYGAKYDTKKMLIIDDGDYQGTQIFILHKDVYQPYVENYVYTNTYYGSCSGCDILQAISCYAYDELPDDEQVKDYMELCLHLLQKCTYMVDGEVDC